jgi:hypothetical protein
MATEHAKVVAWLSKNVGQHEVPPGSNTGPFVQSCQAATWLAGTRFPWCVATWVKAWTVAGRTLPYRGAGAYSMLAWYKAHLPAWVVPLNRAKPGAAVILNIGSGHLATLEHAYAGGPTVETIDGNWGDAVARVKHPVTLVRGVIDPAEKDTGVIPPAKPPVFEVVTSASGHAKLVYSSGAKAVGRKLPALLNRYGGLTIKRRKK